MEKLFISVLNLSLISSYVILFILAIRLLLRKAPKVFSYALWAIVFFKLSCPATFESMISLIPEQVSTHMIVNTDINDTTTHEKTTQIESPVEPDNIEMSSNLKTTDKIKSKPTVVYYLSMIWVSGILIGFVYSLISTIILKKRLSSAVNVRDNLYESSETNTPFVMGMLRPKIYLPVELSKEEQTYIIRHEQVHIQRRDYLIKIAAFSISCIHWFNPLVWLSFLLMNRDMEMSCDEKVMKELGSDIKKVYSSSLLSLAVGRKMPNGIPLAFGERDIKSRIKNVLNYKKPTLWIIIVSTLVVVVAGIGLFFNPSSNNNKDKEQPVELEEFIIADDEITLYDKTIANIQLIMTKGTYYEEEYAGAGGGTYPENYMGDYELRLISKDGKVLSTLSLNKDWDYTQINFSGEFDILFTDYNSDSCPDFTIGTYGSANIGLYYLYSITEENQIKRICETSISENSKESSVVFQHEPQDELYQFLTYVYNNAAGQNEQHIYNWDVDSGNFILSEVTQFNESGEAENTRITFLFDITQDGRKETFVVDSSTIQEEQKATLFVQNENGDIIWSEDAYLPHSGWNSLFLTTIDDQVYILRYHPNIFQGIANYSYDLFYLDETGKEQSIANESINFSINSGDASSYDINNLATFADSLNSYLEKSFLLLSTEEGTLEYSTNNNKVTRTESYSWLEDGTITYSSDNLYDKLLQYYNEIMLYTTNSEDDVYEQPNKITNDFKWYGKTSLISEKMVLPETLIKSTDDMNNFLESDSTIALLATIPDEDIYLYGLKENGSGNEDDFLYRLHGICIRKEDEIQVLDIDWGIYGNIPLIQYEDYDNDGQKELAIILRSAQGTGLSLLDLHVFEKAEDGGLVDNFFTDWADQLNKLVTYEVKEGILKLSVKGEQLEEIDIAAQEETWGEKFQSIVFGDNVEFLFDNGKIYLQVQPNAIAGNWVTPQEITDTYIRMEVQYNGGFELK